MSQLELSPDIFTTGYEGEAGNRIFYIQARSSSGTYAYLVEKEQVAALADRLRELLMLIDAADTVQAATPGRDPALDLERPVEAEWRVGTLGLAFDEDDDRIIVFAQPVDAEDELDVEAEAGVRFRLRRDQVRAFVLHAIAIVSEGRPVCQLCGLPIDPEGHDCPARNGHRRSM